VPVTGGAPYDVGHEERGGIPMGLAREGNKIAYLTGLNGNLDEITVEDGILARCDVPDPANNTGQAVMQNCGRNFGCIPGAFPGALLLRDGRIYWGDGEQLRTGLISGGRDPIAMSPDNSAVSGIAAGATDVYVAFAGDPNAEAAPDDGLIERVPYTATDSSAAVLVARGQRSPSALVAAADRLYWATGECAINSIAP
jgi:hypothetical protein